MYREGVDVRLSGISCNIIVYPIIAYRLETWAIYDPMLVALEEARVGVSSVIAMLRPKI